MKKSDMIELIMKYLFAFINPIWYLNKRTTNPKYKQINIDTLCYFDSVVYPALPLSTWYDTDNSMGYVSDIAIVKTDTYGSIPVEEGQKKEREEEKDNIAIN